MGAPKFILATATSTDVGSVVVSFATPREGECLKIARIIDHTSEPTDIDYRWDGIQVLYYSDLEDDGGTRNYTVIFENGEQEFFTLFIPGRSQGIADLGIIGGISLTGRDGEYSYVTHAKGTIGKYTGRTNQALMAQSDPSGKFGFEGVYKSDGITLDVSSLGHLPTVDPRPEEQAMYIVSTVGGDYDSAQEMWVDALSGTDLQTSFTLIWSKDLPEEDFKQAQEFSVCKAEGHADYYRTTGLDCNGVAIPAGNLSGAIPSIFKEGCDCVTNYRHFGPKISITDAPVQGTGEIKVTITEVPGSPARESLADKDAYEAEKYPVYPALNTYTYNYTMTPPPGLGAQVSIGPVNSDTHTFTGLAPGPGVYTITAENVQSGITATLTAVIIERSASKSAGGGGRQYCDDPTALNFFAAAGEPCAACCVYCSQNQLWIADSPGPNLILDVNTLIENTLTIGASDGVINFNAQPNPAIDPLVFDGGVFDLFIYNTVGNGEVLGTLVNSQLGVAYPAYAWTGLPTGWYAVNAQLQGANCNSIYYFFVGEPLPAPLPCTAAIDVAIDACTGLVSAFAETDGEPFTLTYMVNGLPVSPPINVAEGDVLEVIVNFRDSVCETSTSIQTVTAADLNCIGPPPPPPPSISGCMETEALNYNPAATVPDGSCAYPVFGCGDSSATNYDVNVTNHVPGDCYYAISGCMDPLAGNYDPNATIPGEECVYPCTEPIIDTINVVGLTPTIVFANVPLDYSVIWYNLTLETQETIENSPVGSDVNVTDIWLVTVVTGAGCSENYILSLVPIIYGCMDPHATNFAPAANVDIALEGTNGSEGAVTTGGPCEYQLEILPCRPSDVEQVMDATELCLSTMGTTYFNLLRTGRLTDCKASTFILVHLIHYLLSQNGLECIYNCADSITGEYNPASCNERWTEGGPTGSELVWDVGTAYQWGDVVQYGPSQLFYVYIHNGQPISGMDPEELGSEDHWAICVEPVIPSDTTNRLDVYLAYLKEHCEDCGLPGVPTLPEAPIEPGEGPATSEGDPLVMDGDELIF